MFFQKYPRRNPTKSAVPSKAAIRAKAALTNYEFRLVPSPLGDSIICNRSSRARPFSPLPFFIEIPPTKQSFTANALLTHLLHIKSVSHSAAKQPLEQAANQRVQLK
jgi:hypothetical protein